MRLVYASLNPNFLFKGLYASPNQSFLSFEGILRQNVFKILLFQFQSRVNNCEVGMYHHYTGVLYLHNSFEFERSKKKKELVKSYPPYC